MGSRAETTSRTQPARIGATSLSYVGQEGRVVSATPALRVSAYIFTRETLQAFSAL